MTTMTTMLAATVEEDLREAGFGHRAIGNGSGSSDEREVYVLATGEVMGRMTVFEALEFLVSQLPPETWRAD